MVLKKISLKVKQVLFELHKACGHLTQNEILAEALQTA